MFYKDPCGCYMSQAGQGRPHVSKTSSEAAVVQAKDEGDLGQGLDSGCGDRWTGCRHIKGGKSHNVG